MAPLLPVELLLKQYKATVYDHLDSQQQRAILEPLQDSGTWEQIVSGGQVPVLGKAYS